MEPELLLPKSRPEIEKWCDHYYRYEPVVQQFVDYVFLGPPTKKQLTEFLTPLLKNLAYRDQERIAEYEKKRLMSLYHVLDK